jgi:hypothetical protein
LVKKAFSLVDTSLTGSLVTNILLAGVLGLAMKQIWALINTLQILTLIPLMEINLPYNLVFCLQALSDVSNLKIIPKKTTDWVLSQISLLKKDSPLMEDLGYIIVMVVGAFGMLGVLLLLSFLSKKFPK